MFFVSSLEISDFSKKINSFHTIQCTFVVSKHCLFLSDVAENLNKIPCLKSERLLEEDNFCQFFFSTNLVKTKSY